MSRRTLDDPLNELAARVSPPPRSAFRREDRHDPSVSTVPAYVRHLAREIAAQVVDELRATDFPGYVDQSASPLGRRRHIQAIRSGKLRGARVGRRYLARQEDIERFLAERREEREASRRSQDDAVDTLAADLGLRRRQP